MYSQSTSWLQVSYLLHREDRPFRYLRTRLSALQPKGSRRRVVRCLLKVYQMEPDEDFLAKQHNSAGQARFCRKCWMTNDFAIRGLDG